MIFVLHRPNGQKVFQPVAVKLASRRARLDVILLAMEAQQGQVLVAYASGSDSRSRNRVLHMSIYYNYITLLRARHHLRRLEIVLANLGVRWRLFVTWNHGAFVDQHNRQHLRARHSIAECM